jgi:hypothetical protein
VKERENGNGCEKGVNLQEKKVNNREPGGTDRHTLGEIPFLVIKWASRARL